MIKTNVQWDSQTGKVLKDLRISQSVPQAPLYERLRIPGMPGAQAVSHIESGVLPKEEHLKDISKGLGADADYFARITQELSTFGSGAKTHEDADKQQEAYMANSDTEKTMSADGISVQTENQSLANENDTDTEANDAVMENGMDIAEITGNTLGERLRSARTRLGFTLELVVSASDVGISKFMLGRYERDERVISEEALTKLAALYDCKVEDLATEEDIQGIRTHYENPRVKIGQNAARKRKSGGRAAAKKARAKSRRIKASKKQAEKETVLKQDAEVKTEAIVQEEKTAYVAQEVNALAEVMKNARVTMGKDAARVAEAAGMPQKEYLLFERGQVDISMSQFLSLCKELRIVPADIVKETFRNAWCVFTAEKTKDFYAVVGMCAERGIEFEPNSEIRTVKMYADRERMEEIFSNLEIRGNF